jgi:hypothetical protein
MLQCLTRRSPDLNGQREVDSPSKRPKPSLEDFGRAGSVLRTIESIGHELWERERLALTSGIL